MLLLTSQLNNHSLSTNKVCCSVEKIRGELKKLHAFPLRQLPIQQLVVHCLLHNRKPKALKAIESFF